MSGLHNLLRDMTRHIPFPSEGQRLDVEAQIDAHEATAAAPAEQPDRSEHTPAGD